jgi:hypothetical protein
MAADVAGAFATLRERRALSGAAASATTGSAACARTSTGATAPSERATRTASPRSVPTTDRSARTGASAIRTGASPRRAMRAATGASPEAAIEGAPPEEAATRGASAHTADGRPTDDGAGANGRSAARTKPRCAAATVPVARSERS